jgi:hypothetical protein
MFGKKKKAYSSTYQVSSNYVPKYGARTLHFVSFTIGA